MKKRIIYICFFLLYFSVDAQKITIVDLNNNPVANAAVFNEKKTIYVLSDLDGVVNLSRFKEKELIYFQHPKYTSLPIQKNSLESSYWGVEEMLYEISEVTLLQNQNQNNIKNSAEKKIFISKKEIEKLNTENLADLLEKKGGISVQKSQFGGGSPNIRGFEANKILLVLDGVRLNNAIYRSGHLQNIITIDESILENTEVVFGPSSVLYGSDALGGTINMLTKKLYFSNEPNIESSFFTRYASAYNGFSTHQSLLYESKKFSIFNAITLKDYGDVIMGRNRRHGYSDWGLMHFYTDESGEVVMNNNPNIQRNTGFQQMDLINKMLFKINNSWRLTSNIQLSTSSNVPRFDKLNDVTDEICKMCGNNKPKFRYWFYGPQNRFFSSLSLEGYEDRLLFDKSEFILGFQKIEESRNFQKVNVDSLTKRKEIVNVLSLNMNFKKNNISYGIETIHNAVSSSSNAQEIALGSTRYPAGGSNTFSSAFYINYLKNLNERLFIETGLRNTFSYLSANFDIDSIPPRSLGISDQNVTASWTILSGNAKLTYYPSDSWKISTVFSKGFHTPNIDDMAKIFVKSGNLTVPNINLGAETVFSQEIFISNENKFGVFYFNGFRSQVNNAIIKDTILVNLNASAPPGTPELLTNQAPYQGEVLTTFANQNLSRVDIVGFTLGFDSKLINTFNLRGDINYTKGINLETSIPVAHIPPVFGKLSISRLGNKASYFLDFHYSFKKEASEFDVAGVDNLDETPFEISNPNTQSEIITYYGLPPWSTLNFSLSYNFSKKINAQFSLNNIFDIHYKSFGSGISAPGRNFISTIRINY